MDTSSRKLGSIHEALATQVDRTYDTKCLECATRSEKAEIQATAKDDRSQVKNEKQNCRRMQMK